MKIESNKKWSKEALESLQSLERYTVLKAIDEGKRLVNLVMETALKEVEEEIITKFHVQNTISKVLNEIGKPI